MAFIGHKKSNKKITNPNITQTLMVSLKKNRILESPHKKKTTFLELFFDLAIVFVFTALSSRFADFLGISPKSFIGEEHVYEVTHAEAGLFFWIINFVALWQVWYRYGVLFRNYGNEGIMSHFLTFALVIAVGLQAISLTVDTEFFTKYGLIISFVIAKVLLYIFEVTIVVASVRAGKIDKKNLRKLLYETIGMGALAVMIIVYTILEREGMIDFKQVGSHLDPARAWTMISGIILITIFVDLFISMIFHTQTVQMNEMSIYAHTKERHHLLILIALGESVLFNISKGAMNDVDVVKMIPDLVLNLSIIMFMWFIYKNLIYRATYAKGSRNVTIFAIVHIFMIAGMMLMFSSLEAYSEAQAEYNHFHHIQETLPNHPTFIAIDDIKHAMQLTYPTIYMMGFGVFLLSMIATYWLMKPGKEIYDKALMKKRKWVTLSHLVILAVNITIFIILVAEIKFDLTYIFIVMLSMLILEFLTGTYLTNRSMLILTGSADTAVHELSDLEK